MKLRFKLHEHNIIIIFKYSPNVPIIGLLNNTMLIQTSWKTSNMKNNTIN